MDSFALENTDESKNEFEKIVSKYKQAVATTKNIHSDKQYHHTDATTF